MAVVRVNLHESGLIESNFVAARSYRN